MRADSIVSNFNFTEPARRLLQQNRPTPDSCVAAKARLLDHLVGAQQNRLRYRKAKRLGGLEVHGHLKFCRKLHREIARLRAAQNAINISGGPTKVVY